MGLCCTFIIASAVFARTRVDVWNDPVRFWLETAKVADASNHVVPGQAAVALFNDGYPEEAAALALRTLRVLGPDVDRQSSPYRIAVVDFAETLAALGKYEQAEQALTAVLQDNPGFAFGWYRLGRVEAWLEKWDLARTNLERAVQLGPQDPAPTAFLAGLSATQDLAASIPDEGSAEASIDKMRERARDSTLLGHTLAAERTWRQLGDRTKDPTLTEVLRFFASLDATAHNVGWALHRLDEVRLPKEQGDALRLLLTSASRWRQRREMKPFFLRYTLCLGYRRALAPRRGTVPFEMVRETLAPNSSSRRENTLGEDRNTGPYDATPTPCRALRTASERTTRAEIRFTLTWKGGADICESFGCRRSRSRPTAGGGCICEATSIALERKRLPAFRFAVSRPGFGVTCANTECAEGIQTSL